MSDLHTFRKIKSENREKGAFFAFLQAEMPKNLEVPKNRCTFALSINRYTCRRSGTMVM